MERIDAYIFRRKAAVKEKLISYGFSEINGGFRYIKDFTSRQFRADVFIGNTGTVYGRVIDNETDEEYFQVFMENQGGSFVAQVREEYLAIMQDIADNCFRDVTFNSPQSNRLEEMISEKYGEQPDFPFGELEGSGVFRCQSNRKWYGLIMNVARGKVSKTDSEEPVDVINVKVMPEKREEYLAVEGIYPAYHMNKQKWLTAVLDGSLPDSLIMTLIDESRSLVSGKVSSAVEKRNWIVPANPAYYDIDGAFAAMKDVGWKQGAGIREGDTVYMYVGAPVSAVRYRCKVTVTDIPLVYEDENVRMKSIMKMDVEKIYPADVCPFSRLQQLGIAAVRGPRRVTEEFLRYMDKF